MTLSKLAAFALALTALWVTPAVAQEQENPSTPGQIPDPSTYQGSTVLQQQSDQQDQQYRQQQGQQQQNAPQYGGQYSSRNYGNRSYGQAGSVSVHERCMQMLTRSVAALRGLVALSGDSVDDARYFAISRRPTAAERAALMRWLAGRRRCNSSITWSVDPIVRQAQTRGTQDMNNMIAALAQGRMTYGEFNYRRARIAAAFSRFAASH